MVVYRIADISIGIEPEIPRSIKRLKSFKAETFENIDLHIRIRKMKYIHKIIGSVFLEEEAKWIKNGEGKFSVLLKDEKNGQRTSLLEASTNWSETTVDFINNRDFGGYSAPELLIGIAFRNRLISFDGTVIHASAVAWQDQGFIFTAPSGTGKSTHAALWEKHLGAVVINDDCPALRVMDGQTYVYGTPWSGSGMKFLNEKRRLKAIVLLEQNNENSIARLGLQEAIKRLLPRFFIPYQDPALIDKVMITIESILASTPVYLLKCRPDLEAVELVRNCLME